MCNPIHGLLLPLTRNRKPLAPSKSTLAADLSGTAAAMAPWGLNRHRRESKSSQNESMISKRVDSTSNLALDGSPVLATDTGRNNNEDGNSTDYDAPSTHKRRRPFHVRSMSNPFPGLFSGKRSKKKRSDSTTRLLQEPQSSDNEPTMKSPRNTTSLRGDAGHAEAKDLTTGICMTCGSTMRWPKALDTFKCSICVTINDLVPLGTQQSRERKTRDRRGRISSMCHRHQLFSHLKHVC